MTHTNHLNHHLCLSQLSNLSIVLRGPQIHQTTLYKILCADLAIAGKLPLLRLRWCRGRRFQDSTISLRFTILIHLGLSNNRKNTDCLRNLFWQLTMRLVGESTQNSITPHRLRTTASDPQAFTVSERFILSWNLELSNYLRCVLPQRESP